jgi:hypothetical protein
MSTSTSVKIEEKFKEEIARGLNIVSGGRDTIEYVAPTTTEISEVDKCIDQIVSVLRKASPSVAADFQAQKTIFEKFAGVAKAKFPGLKSITYPGTSGNIGVMGLVPEAIRYVATPADATPAYTSYPANSWDISLTAGTAAYLFGDATHFYKASPTDGSRALLVVAQNGLIEIGSTPKIVQQRIFTEAETKYGPWAVQPLAEIPTETGKTIYQYNTLGVVPIYHDFGIKWGIMPIATGTSTLKLLGLVFYEYGLFPDLKYVS